MIIPISHKIAKRCPKVGIVFFKIDKNSLKPQSAMSQKEQIPLFEENKVRTVWGVEKEEWNFSVVDVAGVPADSTNPKQYIKK